jgi:hypothetical protein
VKDNFAPPFCTDIKGIALAPPAAASYIPHDSSALLSPGYSRGFFFNLYPKDLQTFHLKLSSGNPIY